MECTADRHRHANHLQGHVYGSSLKIISVANGWHVSGGYDLANDKEGKHWVFQDAAQLGRFVADWCCGGLPSETES